MFDLSSKRLLQNLAKFLVYSVVLALPDKYLSGTNIHRVIA